MKPLMKRILLPMFVLICFAGISLAVPASPEFFETEQPDGERITLKMQGDEFYNWTEDKQGYTVIKDRNTREWFYAEQDKDGNLQKTKHRVGNKTSPQTLGIPKHLKKRNFQTTADERRMTMHAADDLRKNHPQFSVLSGNSGIAASGAQIGISGSSGIVLTGAPSAVTYKHLVILVAFADKPFAITNPKKEFEDLFNQEKYSKHEAHGSVKDYFEEVSYGTLILETVVTEVVHLSKTNEYYKGSTGYENAREMVTDALTALDEARFDFSGFEESFITVVHAGAGLEAGGDSMWSHKWSVNNFRTWDNKRFSVYATIPELRGNGKGVPQITTIGVACHELGHAMLGLPDLYDITDMGEGVGNYCVMGSGNWNGFGALGNVPSHFCAWSKNEAGFINVTELSSEGAYVINTAASDKNSFYKFSGATFATKEYFLMENRQDTGFDAGLPGSNRGILIWHIDESVSSNANRRQYMVGLKEADGSNDLAMKRNRGKDSHYFRAGNNTNFTDTTNPNSKSYSGKSADFPITRISVTGKTMTFMVGYGVAGSINSISPAVSKFGKSVEISIYGDNFIDSSVAKLIFENQSITASSTVYVSSGQINAFFNIPSNSRTGNWDIILENYGYVSERVTKTEAFSIEENILLTGIDKTVAIEGTQFSAGITGKQFDNLAGLRLENQSEVINASTFTVHSPESANIVFDIPNLSVQETFNLTALNSEGDLVTIPNAVIVYQAPAITSFSYKEFEFSTLVEMTVNGSNFLLGDTIIKLKRESDGEEITPSISSFASDKIICSFDITAVDTGTWNVCAVSLATGYEYLSAVTYNANHSPYNELGVIMAFNGVTKNASVFVSEGTFPGGVTVTITQETNFVMPDKNSGFTHTGIGVKVEAQGNQPSIPLLLKIPYTIESLGSIDENALVIARYDDVSNKWIPLDSEIDPADKSVSAKTDHLSVFAILAKIPSPMSVSTVFKFYPNPVRNNGFVNFENLSSKDATITIYTYLGKKVKTLKIAAGAPPVQWDTRNESGDRVSSGVYIGYVEYSGGDKKTIKIMIQR